jgi:hypothetical protein
MRVFLDTYLAQQCIFDILKPEEALIYPNLKLQGQLNLSFPPSQINRLKISPTPLFFRKSSDFYFSPPPSSPNPGQHSIGWPLEASLAALTSSAVPNMSRK